MLSESQGETSGRLTWESLVAMEPRLESLIEEAKALRRGGMRGHRIWDNPGDPHQSFRHRLAALVGGFRQSGEHPVLKTHEAWDLAFQRLKKVMFGPCNC